MAHSVTQSHTKVLQIALLRVMPLVTATLSVPQQLYKRGVRARRLRDRRLQAGLVRVVVVVDFLGRGGRWNGHTGGCLVRRR